MPNIEFHGVDKNYLSKICDDNLDSVELLKNEMDKILLSAGLEKESVKRFYCNPVFSCEGVNQNKPFIRIYSSRLVHIFKIMAAFQRFCFCFDIEIISAGLFYFLSHQEIISGDWRQKFGIQKETLKNRSDLIKAIFYSDFFKEKKNSEKKSSTIYECYGPNENAFINIELTGKRNALKPKILKKVESMIKKGKSIITLMDCGGVCQLEWKIIDC